MGCTDPVRQCLDWHFRPHLAHAVLEEGGNRVRARCPSCGTLRALTVSPKASGHGVMCGCFSGCAWPALRVALRGAGVPDTCLPALSREDKQAACDAVSAVIEQGTIANRARTLLRVYLISLGHVCWPKGSDLLKLASACGVSRAEAYAAKKTGPLLPSPRYTHT